jgi:CRP/FNR family cyclic AMP-dependent transcriptional regulator
MDYRALEDVSLFQDLGESELREIFARSVTRFFPKGSIVVNEGDQTDSLYIIMAGKVKVFSSDEEGKEVVFSTLRRCEYFGEVALIDDEPRSASVMTVENSKLTVISKVDFQEYLTRYPSIAISLLRTLARRMRIETENIKSLALMDVYGRVAKTLLDLSAEQNGKRITDRITHREIANMVGASREMVGRILKDLKQGGYISVESGRIVINDNLPPRW